jgi:cysteine-rich repeat protein
VRVARRRSDFARSFSSLLPRLILVVATIALPLTGAAQVESLMSGHAKARLRGGDCNNNGVPDEQDTRPLQFTAGMRFPAGGNPVSAVAADFDGDGDVDFAVTNLVARTVSVLRNNGFGYLEAPEPFHVSDYPSEITAADFNRDGAVDLAVRTGGSVTVLSNDGTAHFTKVASLAGDATITSIITADVDGDGDVDLFFTSGGTAFLAKNEGGTWQSPTTVPFGTVKSPVAAADLDSDGDLDLVFGNGFLVGSSVFVAANNGDGTFAQPTAVAEQVFIDAPSDVAVGDLDGDGDLDLALVFPGMRSGNSAWIALNHGDGTFTPGSTIPVPPDMVASQNKRLRVAAGDIDSDGDLDLAVVNNYALLTAVLRNRGDATFSADETHVTDTGYAVLLADVNGDAKLDLTVLAAKLVIMPNDGQGNLISAPLWQVPEVADPMGGPVSLVAADVDGDGDLDLVTANFQEDSVSLLVNQGGGSFAPPITFKVADGPGRIAAADVDANGRADLAVANEYANQVTLLSYVGTGQLSPVQTLSLSRPYRVEFARLDHDGHPDLVVASGTSLVSFLNDGSGQLIRGGSIDLGRFITALTVADFDRDGDDEIALTNDWDNVISVVSFWGNGDPTATTLQTGGLPVSIVAVDFDTDGAVDIVVTHEPPSFVELPTVVSVLCNDGGGSFLPRVDLPLGVGGPLAIGDLDGDGTPDMVIGSTVVRNYGLQTVPRVTDFAVWPRVAGAVVADLDGDHSPEIAIAHSGSGAHSAIDRGGITVLRNETPNAASRDCNLNRVPDECEVAVVDCDHNGIPDDCEPDTDRDSVIDGCDQCPGEDDLFDRDGDHTPDCLDGCPWDPAKSSAGVCGCSRPDIDADGDAWLDCQDNCPEVTNTDQANRDGDTYGDACDSCPDDPAKHEPGLCGCGAKDTDSDWDGYPNCTDACPQDRNKFHDAGICGCGHPELDIDNDGVIDCGTPGPTQTWTATQTPGGPTVTATPTATPTRTPAHFVVDRVQDAADTNPGDGQCLIIDGGCSLRAAVQEANALAGLDLITVPTGNYVLTLSGNDEDHCATGDLDILDYLTITGAGADTTAIDGNAQERVLEIVSGAHVVITGLTIRNGRNADSRGVPNVKAVGGILNAGTLTLEDCNVTENVAPTQVGSMFGVGTGGILNEGSLTLTNGSVTKNRGPQEGGILNRGSLYVNGAVFSQNSANDWGGALRNLGTATITSVRMERNSVQPGPESGTIYNIGSLTVTDSAITETSVASGLWNESGQVTAERLTIANNAGGGIRNGGTMTLTATTIEGNGDVTTMGGGVDNGGTLLVTATTITGNEGWAGGGLANSGHATVVNSTVSDNRAYSKGGGLFNFGDLRMRSVTITANRVDSSADGGGLFGEASGAIYVQNSILAGNSAKTATECAGTLESEGYNLIADTTGCLIIGDIVGNIIGDDPELGSLEDNGGPTLTHAPGHTSPVLEAGAPTGSGCESVDQRGVVRPQGAACDIGAVEVMLACGNGRLDDGEQCDQGNTANGDCCSVLCQRLPVVGDCDGNSSVSIDELVRGVNIALGSAHLDQCAQLDGDGNGRVTIDELVRAVRYALEGC